MFRITAIALVTALLSPASIPALPAEGVPAPVVIQVEAKDPAQLQMTEWALGRFEEAGLRLPDLHIVFPGQDLSLCNGAPATALTHQRPIEIRLCWNDRFILLHELAHAWDAHNLTEDRRESFMALRAEVDAWTGADVPWARRGIEHAANVIAWGLLEDPYPISRTYPNDPESLIEAFRVLTGVAPLHDGGSPIQRPDRSVFAGSNPPLESGR
ncbi:MAG: hypothetical protein QNJ77_14295 [Acidimicrobiia bacterium]|nr:hypothetical protein [Acidimicrobiia bacterium]